MKRNCLFLLYVVLVACFGCSKNSDNQKIKLRMGSYYLSDTVYFDSLRLYTRHTVTSDTSVISPILNRFANEEFFGNDIIGFTKNEFKLIPDYQTLDNPFANSSVKILSGQIAILLNFPVVKDSTICDITPNSDGTYTLTNRDSSDYYAAGCSAIELSMLDTLDFRKYRIHGGVDVTSLIYRGRNKFLIEQKNGQIVIHAFTVLIYSSEGCWGLISNSLKRHFPPTINLLKPGDTVLIQNKTFAYKQL